MGVQEIVTAGVPAVNMASVDGSGPSEVWQKLATVLETFFFGNNSGRSYGEAGAAASSPTQQLPLPRPSDGVCDTHPKVRIA